MRTLKPQDYLDEVYPEADICPKTVINWIKKGKIRGEKTPTGRWLVMLEKQPESHVSSIVKMLEAAA